MLARLTIFFSLALLIACGDSQPESSASSSSSSSQPNPIEFTYIPRYNNNSDPRKIEGKVNNINIQEHKVVVYVYLNSWYIKPNATSPLTTIQSDGTWSVDLLPLPNLTDSQFTKVRAFLVKGTTTPPTLGSGHLTFPTDFVNESVSSVEVKRYQGTRIINFSGYKWFVKASSIPIGPGDNYFSDSTDNVWVDGNGDLHLTIKFNGSNWECTEICTTNIGFGYGSYIFQVKSRVDTIDTNAVLGLFVFDYDAPYPHREFDFEFMHWQGGTIAPSNHNSSSVVQPYYNPGNLYTYEMKLSNSRPETTHIAQWSASSINFTSMLGYHMNTTSTPDIIANNVYSGSDLPTPGNEQVILNFWLPFPTSKMTHSGTDIEVIIKAFNFTPE